MVRAHEPILSDLTEELPSSCFQVTLPRTQLFHRLSKISASQNDISVFFSYSLLWFKTNKFFPVISSYEINTFHRNLENLERQTVF